MPRLQDSILEPAGQVAYALIGTSDRHGQPVIEVRVRGTVPLQCQRCLERLDYGLDRTSRLALIAPGAQLPDVAQEDPDTEAIAAAEVANVADLIEQEVLLGLPLAPMHDEACAPAQAPAADKVESPFAVLQTLKQKRE
jgi:uncharacterized protein